jgi:hypothetical protein
MNFIDADPGSGERGGSPVLHIKIHGQFQRCFKFQNFTVNFKDFLQRRGGQAR